MTRPDPIERRDCFSAVAVLLVAGLAVGAWASVSQGQDASWDLRAYHWYAGWAFWNDRLLHDIAPAGMHTFFNPALDTINYALLAASPRSGTAALGAWSGLGFFLAGLVGFMQCRSRGRGLGFSMAVGLAIVALAGTGALTFSLSGLTSNEAQLIPFVAAAFARVHFAAMAPDARRQAAWCVAGGFAAGAATGLKLTQLSYAAGFGVTLLALAGIERRQALLLWGIAGVLAGFALAGGAWAWRLAEHFGNPVFPFFDEWFHSPHAKLYDPLFIPVSRQALLTAALAPFSWFGQLVVWEAPFRDARIPAGLVAAAFGVLVLCWRMVKGRAQSREDRALWLLCVFYVGSFAAWVIVLRVSARYLAALESLSACLVIVMLIRALIMSRSRAVTAGFAVICACLVLAGATRPPDWGRIPFGARAVSFEPPRIEPDSLVLLIDRPDNSNQLTHLIPSLEPTATYVQPWGQLARPGDGTLVTARIGQAVRQAPRIYALYYADREAEFRAQVFDALALRPGEPLQIFRSNLSGERIAIAEVSRR